MIYTLTLNPSLDYLVETPDIKMGETNRSSSESLHFGGKGINVSYILNQLGISSVCLGFISGFTGKELERMLKTQGLITDFVNVPNGNTRINVKIKSSEITEINACGIVISEKDKNELFEKLDVLKNTDTLILAGSTPKGMDNVYSEILHRLSGRGIRFVVDTSGQKLFDCLKYNPFLIKPNKAELEELFKTSFESEQEIIPAARKLKSLGAVNVLVSMGSEGALLVDEYGKVHRVNAKKITPVSTVGAGDSMVAGFLSGLDKGYEYALTLGNACGAATASCEILADKEKICSLM